MFHRLPLQLSVTNALYFVIHFTGLKSMRYFFSGIDGLPFSPSPALGVRYLANQSLKNKNLYREPIQLFAYITLGNTAPVTAKVSKCFCVNLWLIKIKKLDRYADFKFAMCFFLVGG